MTSDGEAKSSALEALGGFRSLRELAWWCACTVYGVRLAGAEMGEDSLDEVGGLDARDDAQCPTTKRDSARYRDGRLV